MYLPRKALIAGSSTLLLAAVLAGCSDQVVSPVTRSPGARASVKAPLTPLITTSTLWDFANIANEGANTPFDLGTSHTFSIAGSGSIVATTDRHISVKGQLLAQTDPERGLGLCHPSAASCAFPDDGDEVGDPGSPPNGGVGELTLDFNGVLPAGSTVNLISLGSLQAGEAYRYSISTNGGGSFSAPVDVVPNNGNDLADLVLGGGNGLPAAGLQIKFERSPASTCLTADPACDDDYTVRTVTTEFTTNPLQGRMTGGGVKATNDAGDPVTFGVEIHCDIILSNNIEINWPGHKWHLTKPIVSSDCENQNNDAPPPASPIDTFKGVAFGELDGVGDSKITWDFEDHGEPGTNDKVELTVFAPGSNTIVMHITLQNISIGNWQMHYDQPHGFKP
jgi:hypothetical protein